MSLVLISEAEIGLKEALTQAVQNTFKDASPVIRVLIRSQMIHLDFNVAGSVWFKQLNKLKNGVFIYSMWKGYQEETRTKDFIDYLISRGMTKRHIHTSGHADKTALQRMIDATNPKYIIPIHTFNANDYQKHFKNPVKVLKDGETFFC